MGLQGFIEIFRMGFVGPTKENPSRSLKKSGDWDLR